MTLTKPELTYKHNRNRGRHGWLRLTPAYSVEVVQNLLESLPTVSHILDPFCGTGTTGLVAAERGLTCTLLEINPFLVWFAQSKVESYTHQDITIAQDVAAAIARVTPAELQTHQPWLPPLHNIERWWSPTHLHQLSFIRQQILATAAEAAANLLWIAFCKVLIESSNAAFNHQSMSFRKLVTAQPRLWQDDEPTLMQHLQVALEHLLPTAHQSLSGEVHIHQTDSRTIPAVDHPYDCVITSPPYPNRMSYIRELRPYMYWLGYLTEAREAAELDWQAIGGTWGAATSRLQHWQPDTHQTADPSLITLVESIRLRSPVLANYVHKYFVDTDQHLQSVYAALAPGAPVFYVVGNSKFYDTLVPVDELYAHLLRKAGFVDTAVRIIRKRNSKKELYEYIVSAHKPPPASSTQHGL
jgi:hypothetical protein